MNKSKPNPYDVIQALKWLQRWCPVEKTASQHVRTLIEAVNLLADFDPLYCYGTPENHQALREHQRRIYGTRP